MKLFTLAPSPFGGFAFLPTDVPYPWLVWKDDYYFDWPDRIPQEYCEFPHGWRPLQCDGLRQIELPKRGDLVLTTSWYRDTDPPLSWFGYHWEEFDPDHYYVGRFIRQIKDP